MAHRLFEMIEAPLAALRWAMVYILQDSTADMILKAKWLYNGCWYTFYREYHAKHHLKKDLDDLQRNCTSIHGIHSTE